MTRIDLRLEKTRRAPVCVGAGFVALDVIRGESGSFAATGGSCGNVITILAWLGWRARLSSRLGKDVAGDMIVSELASSGVDLNGVVRDERVSTPIVLQRFIARPDGGRIHRYALSCPDCGRWLPRFRPATLHQMAPLLENITDANVCYLDRVTPSSKRLAKAASESGALVMFEPSAIGDERAFQRSVDSCDILKYSYEQLGHVPDLATVSTPKVIIETRGEEGLRVRWRGRWSVLPAFKAPSFKDAAGSGDWCTASLIHSIGTRGLATLRKVDLEKGLRLGQALAALNCGFEGARGLMAVNRLGTINRALRWLQEKSPAIPSWPGSLGTPSNAPAEICGACAVQKRGQEESNEGGETNVAA